MLSVGSVTARRAQSARESEPLRADRHESVVFRPRATLARAAARAAATRLLRGTGAAAMMRVPRLHRGVRRTACCGITRFRVPGSPAIELAPHGSMSSQRLNEKPFFHAAKLITQYRATLDGCGEITIRVWFQLSTQTYSTTQSHELRVPGREGEHRPRAAGHASADAALDDAVRGYLHHYRAAIENGLAPEGRWLVPNAGF